MRHFPAHPTPSAITFFFFFIVSLVSRERPTTLIFFDRISQHCFVFFHRHPSFFRHRLLLSFSFLFRLFAIDARLKRAKNSVGVSRLSRCHCFTLHNELSPRFFNPYVCVPRRLSVRFLAPKADRFPASRNALVHALRSSPAACRLQRIGSFFLQPFP